MPGQDSSPHPRAKGLHQYLPSGPVWSSGVPVSAWGLTSNVQHGLIPTVQHLEHRWHLLLRLQEQSLQVH